MLIDILLRSLFRKDPIKGVLLRDPVRLRRTDQYVRLRLHFDTGTTFGKQLTRKHRTHPDSYLYSSFGLSCAGYRGLEVHYSNYKDGKGRGLWL